MPRVFEFSSNKPDSILIWSLFSLIFLGFLMLFASSSWISLQKTESSTYYLFHQFLYGFLPGIFLFYFFSRVSIKFLKNLIPLFFISSMIFLVLVFIPSLNFEAGGASSWLKVGPFTFQPSEFAKLAIILYLAAFFEKKRKENKIKDFKKSFIPFLIILAPFGLLLFLQPDMGTLGIIAIISFLMFFGAEASYWQCLLLIVLGLSVVLCGAMIFPHQAKRITTFLNPEDDALGMGYQINQSLIALGSGGIFGVGFGNGIQKYSYLPQPMGDTIFAIWGEETGIIGTSLVIAVVLIISFRGLIIAKRASNDFSKLLAIGITCWIGIQSFLHIMAVCGLIPFTGLPMPFISYGGSALIFALIGAGILVNISKTE